MVLILHLYLGFELRSLIYGLDLIGLEFGLGLGLGLQY